MSGVPPLDEGQMSIYNTWAQMPLPQLAFNSFANNTSATEIISILAFGARPMGMLIMAPSVAKTFALALLEMVETYEKLSGIKVDTLSEITERMAANRATSQ
jgi:hypothetical protein